MRTSGATDQDRLAGPVAWREAGAAGAPIAVFLHGLGGNRTSWQPQLDALQDLRRCAAWDAPGYGHSMGLPGSLDELAAGAADWITELRAGGPPGPVDVVGLSFGGMIAQQLALARPDLVRTLALLDTSPAFGLDGVTTREEWLASRIEPLHHAATPPERIDVIVAGLVGAGCPPQVRSEVAATMRAVPAATLAAACRALVDHDTRDRLHLVAAATLVMVGAEDGETPPSYAAAISERIPGARLVVVPGAGHLLNLEDPAAVEVELRRLWLGAEIGTGLGNGAMASNEEAGR
jgi:3-oxoadipate enol-lactonase